MHNYSRTWSTYSAAQAWQVEHMAFGSRNVMVFRWKPSGRSLPVMYASCWPFTTLTVPWIPIESVATLTSLPHTACIHVTPLRRPRLLVGRAETAEAPALPAFMCRLPVNALCDGPVGREVGVDQAATVCRRQRRSEQSITRSSLV